MTQSVNQMNSSDTESNIADYMSVYSPYSNDPEWPDESEYVMQGVFGTIFRYQWTVGYNTHGFFKIKSNERCELLFYGNDKGAELKWGINAVNHEGSTLLGLTGPISWSETANFNYFQPGLYHVYFNVLGTLTVAGIGTIEVTNSRYANTFAICGNNIN
ncbi:hypothetical protein [Pedobacter jeongneungensis]|uniref:hypothetical protein n=1 Tax=Pedobacter jeongneungensis TaxID=947309 RepID=UPI0004A7BED0|nr:hypothetical protein [Pedobacter jeongneungensis]